MPWLRTDRIDPADENERIDPADPTDKMEPAEPIESIEPADATDRIEPTEHADWIEAVLKMLNLLRYEYSDVIAPAQSLNAPDANGRRC